MLLTRSSLSCVVMWSLAFIPGCGRKPVPVEESKESKESNESNESPVSESPLLPEALGDDVPVAIAAILQTPELRELAGAEHKKKLEEASGLPAEQQYDVLLAAVLAIRDQISKRAGLADEDGARVAAAEATAMALLTSARPETVASLFVQQALCPDAADGCLDLGTRVLHRSTLLRQHVAAGGHASIGDWIVRQRSVIAAAQIAAWTAVFEHEVLGFAQRELHLDFSRGYDVAALVAAFRELASRATEESLKAMGQRLGALRVGDHHVAACDYTATDAPAGPFGACGLPGTGDGGGVVDPSPAFGAEGPGGAPVVEAGNWQIPGPCLGLDPRMLAVASTPTTSDRGTLTGTKWTLPPSMKKGIQMLRDVGSHDQANKLKAKYDMALLELLYEQSKSMAEYKPGTDRAGHQPINTGSVEGSNIYYKEILDWNYSKMKVDGYAEVEGGAGGPGSRPRPGEAGDLAQSCRLSAYAGLVECMMPKGASAEGSGPGSLACGGVDGDCGFDRKCSPDSPIVPVMCGCIAGAPDGGDEERFCAVLPGEPSVADDGGATTACVPSSPSSQVDEPCPEHCMAFAAYAIGGVVPNAPAECEACTWTPMDESGGSVLCTSDGHCRPLVDACQNLDDLPSGVAASFCAVVDPVRRASPGAPTRPGRGGM